MANLISIGGVSYPVLAPNPASAYVWRDYAMIDLSYRWTEKGFDHGVGHSLLLLYDAKTSHGKNINDFNVLGYDLSTASTSLF